MMLKIFCVCVCKIHKKCNRWRMALTLRVRVLFLMGQNPTLYPLRIILGFIASLNMDVHSVVFVKGKLKHEPKQRRNVLLSGKVCAKA